jgi:hypothetical protein
VIARLRERLTYANVVASLCLFLVLAGGSAVALKGTNRVNSRDIVDDAVRGRDIRDGDIGTIEIGNGEIGPVDRAAAPAGRVSQPHDGPGCAGGQSVADAADEALLFGVEEFDQDATHVSDSTCVNPNRSRLTAPLAGLYEIGAAVEWPANNLGARTLSVRRDGLVALATDRVDAVNGAETLQTVQTLARLDAGDFVEAVVRKTGGGSLIVNGPESYLTLAWLGP